DGGLGVRRSAEREGGSEAIQEQPTTLAALDCSVGLRPPRNDKRDLACALAQQALLGNRGDERAVAHEDQAAGETARARQIRAVLRVQQPFVGAEGTVEPQAVIEARGHDAPVEYRTPEGYQRHVQQGEV